MDRINEQFEVVRCRPVVVVVVVVLAWARNNLEVPQGRAALLSRKELASICYRTSLRISTAVQTPTHRGLATIINSTELQQTWTLVHENMRAV
jgi:hypothetical protein